MLELVVKLCPRAGGYFTELSFDHGICQAGNHRRSQQTTWDGRSASGGPTSRCQRFHRPCGVIYGEKEKIRCGYEKRCGERRALDDFGGPSELRNATTVKAREFLFSDKATQDKTERPPRILCVQVAFSYCEDVT